MKFVGLVECEDTTHFHAEERSTRQHTGGMVIAVCVPEKTHLPSAGLREQQDLQHPVTVCALL